MKAFAVTCFSILLVLAFGGSAAAQISRGGQPISFSTSLHSEIETITMPGIDVAALLVEDSIEEEEGLPFRFGYPFDLNLTPDNSGQWDELPDGGRLWRLRIVCEGAYTINLLYSQYRLPEGAQLFVYSEDRQSVLGAFTDQNNKAHGEFATSPTRGDIAIVEYYEPAAVRAQGELAISRIVHGYKDIFSYFAEPGTRGFGNSGFCNINVNCPEGDPWQLEKRAVAMVLLSSGTRWCSGSLVNNAREDQTPYFLTAYHCLGGQSSWIFMFRYESPGCSNVDGPTSYTLQGSTLRASYSTSDVGLVELDDDPPDSYNVYYAGWSNENTPSSQSVAIHHPSGDIKKISFDYNAVTSTNYLSTSGSTHWRVGNWEDGTTEGGSSGSPLFNPNHQIVGQLHGGYASCWSITADWYGKFSLSWTGGGSSSSRLLDWLDPDNTGVVHMDGFDPFAATVEITHTPLGDTRDTIGNYTVNATITSSYGLINDSLLVYYEIASVWNETLLGSTGVGDDFRGFIPAQSPGTVINYYLLARDHGGHMDSTEVYSFRVIDYDMAIDPDAANSAAAAGETAWFELSVTNTGNYDDDYSFSASFSNWGVGFYSMDDTSSVSSTGTLTADESFVFLAGVDIPTSAFGDLDSVDVIATSSADFTLTRTAVLTSQSMGPLGSLPWVDDFPSTSIDNVLWVENDGGDVSSQALNPPSSPYALKLDGANDTIATQLVDLSGMTETVLSYAYQRGGSLAAPDAGDDLWIDYANDAGVWTNLTQLAGAGETMDIFELTGVILPGDAVHEHFRLRLRSEGDCLGCDNWFVDDVRIDYAAAVSVTPLAFTDTVVQGDFVMAEIAIENSGLGTLHYYLTLSETADWLTLDQQAAHVAPGVADTVPITLTSAALDTGLYEVTIQVGTNDPDPGDDMIGIPISFYVTGIPDYVCGDANNDGVGPDIVDLTFLVMYMFQEGPPPEIFPSVDVNGDGVGPDIVDLTHLVLYMFQEGDPLECLH